MRIHTLTSKVSWVITYSSHSAPFANPIPNPPVCVYVWVFVREHLCVYSHIIPTSQHTLSRLGAIFVCVLVSVCVSVNINHYLTTPNIHEHALHWMHDPRIHAWVADACMFQCICRVFDLECMRLGLLWYMISNSIHNVYKCDGFQGKKIRETRRRRERGMVRPQQSRLGIPDRVCYVLCVCVCVRVCA